MASKMFCFIFFDTCVDILAFARFCVMLMARERSAMATITDSTMKSLVVVCHTPWESMTRS